MIKSEQTKLADKHMNSNESPFINTSLQDLNKDLVPLTKSEYDYYRSLEDEND